MRSTSPPALSPTVDPHVARQLGELNTNLNRHGLAVTFGPLDPELIYQWDHGSHQVRIRGDAEPEDQLWALQIINERITDRSHSHLRLVRPSPA